MPVVNRETSLQIEASTNTFACKDTGKECVFCLELPASHTCHRYHHDVPSFLSRHAAHGNLTWNVPRCAVFACPDPDADTYVQKKAVHEQSPT